MSAEARETFRKTLEGNTSARKVFTVVGAATFAQAVLATGLPALGDVFETGSALVATSYGVGLTNGGSLIEITVNYQNPSDFSGDPDPDDNTTRVQVRVFTEQIAVDNDNDGNPITNSADQPFNPPPTEPRPVLRVTVTKRLSSFLLSTFKSYTGAVNSTAWSIGGVQFADAHEALCEEIATPNQVEQTASDVLVRYQFKIIEATTAVPQPHQLRVFDQGTKAWWFDPDITGADVFTEILTTDEQSAAIEPVPLDGYGRVLRPDRYKGRGGYGQVGQTQRTPAGATREEVTDGSDVIAVWLRYDTKPTLNFNLLGL